jgi:hypothetical protein
MAQGTHRDSSPPDVTVTSAGEAQGRVLDPGADEVDHSPTTTDVSHNISGRAVDTGLTSSRGGDEARVVDGEKKHGNKTKMNKKDDDEIVPSNNQDPRRTNISIQPSIATAGPAVAETAARVQNQEPVRRASRPITLDEDYNEGFSSTPSPPPESAGVAVAATVSGAAKRKTKKKNKTKKKPGESGNDGTENATTADPPTSLLNGVSVISLNEDIELRTRVPGDGDLASDGLYARRPITSGRCILRDPPLMALKKGRDNIWGIYDAYQLLSPREQIILWSFEPQPLLVEPEATAMVNALVYFYVKAAIVGEGQRTPEEQERFEELGIVVSEMCRAWRIAARYLAYRYSLSTAPMTQRDEIPKSMLVTAFFPTAAYFTHSCIPNCFGVYNQNIDRFTVYSTTNIAAGEQLTVSHIGNNIWYQPVFSRADMLREFTGRSCMCPSCTRTDPQFHHREMLRRLQHQRAAIAATCISSIEAHKYPGFGQVATMELDQALDKGDMELRKIIDGLVDLGSTDTEQARWYIQLSTIAMMRKNFNMAVEYAKLACNIGLQCWGPDHPDQKALVRGVKEAEAAKAEVDRQKQEKARQKRLQMLKDQGLIKE